MRVVTLSLLLLVADSAAAQQSSSFQLEEHVFNAGGHPAGEVLPASASFQVTLGSIGEGLCARSLSGPSFRMDGGFGAPYVPPREVGDLRFVDRESLEWDPEPSAGSYNLYRDSLSNLATLGFGGCEQQDLSDTAATDSDPVPAGDGHFYLVTANNLLDEEGTKGHQSDGSERTGSFCP